MPRSSFLWPGVNPFDRGADELEELATMEQFGMDSLVGGTSAAQKFEESESDAAASSSGSSMLARLRAMRSREEVSEARMVRHKEHISSLEALARVQRPKYTQRRRQRERETRTKVKRKTAAAKTTASSSFSFFDMGSELEKARIWTEYHKRTRLEVKDEHRKWKKRVEEEDKQPEKEGAGEVPVQLLLPPSDEERARTRHLMSQPSSSILFERYNVQYTAADLRCLKSGTWLNDEAVNMYMKLLRVRSLDLHKSCPPQSNGKWHDMPCYFHSSLFYTKLTQGGSYGYKGVRRWTRRGFGKADLFAQRNVFFPINCSNVHWTLCVARIQQKRVEYYDSMAGSDRGVLGNIMRYLVDEMKDKKNETLDADEWELVNIADGSPQQSNGVDCGVFLCTAANFISMGQPLTFSQKHMSMMRARISADIVSGSASFQYS